MQRIVSMVALAGVALLAGCEGTHDLRERNCLPLQVPARVTLLQEAGLYTSRSESEPFLQAHPRETANDGFHGIVQQAVLPPGTVLELDGLTQHWGFDSGLGRIGVLGRTADGRRFEYGWGAGTQLGRAPWEPASVPNLREVDCAD